MPLNELISAPVNALVDAYRQNVDMRKRVYGESLVKSFTNRTGAPITNQTFSPEELQSLDEIIKKHYAQKMAQFQRPKAELLANANALEEAAAEDLKYLEVMKPKNPNDHEALTNNARRYRTQAQQLRDAAQGKLPADFSFGYRDYGKLVGDNTYAEDPKGWAQTLGRFRYKVDPKTGEYQVYDRYDFNNLVHEDKVKNYADMSAPQRLANALAKTVMGDKYALGEAYLAGPNSIPVDIRGKVK